MENQSTWVWVQANNWAYYLIWEVWVWNVDERSPIKNNNNKRILKKIKQTNKVVKQVGLSQKSFFFFFFSYIAVFLVWQPLCKSRVLLMTVGWNLTNRRDTFFSRVTDGIRNQGTIWKTDWLIDWWTDRGNMHRSLRAVEHRTTTSWSAEISPWVATLVGPNSYGSHGPKRYTPTSVVHIHLLSLLPPEMIQLGNSHAPMTLSRRLLSSA